MLGRALAAELRARGIPFDEAVRPDVDVTRLEDVVRAVRPGHRVVYNCSAYTDVDGAEADEALCVAVNATAASFLAARCREVGASLVHFSTDYVFAGDASVPYPTDTPLAPQNAYGRSKAAGEEAIRASGCDHLVIRTSWLYAPWGKNFVLTMASLAKTKDTLRVVADQRGRPTSSEHLARSAIALAGSQERGAFHVTDGGECTWFELARHVVGRIRPECTVEPCTTDEFPRPAKRPTYSVLDLARVEAILGPMPTWHEHVDAALASAGLV